MFPYFYLQFNPFQGPGPSQSSSSENFLSICAGIKSGDPILMAINGGGSKKSAGILMYFFDENIKKCFAVFRSNLILFKARDPVHLQVQRISC